jgi:ferredoxin
VSAAEGHKWARVVKDVSAAVTEAGPLPRPSAEAWDGPELPSVEGGGPAELSVAEIEALRTNLRAAASELLNNQRVGLVVGYRTGSLEGRQVPVTVTDAAGCRQLDWGPGSLNNLATYAKSALEKAGKVALVVKTCDLGTVTGLIREGQIAREQVQLIGIQCQGVRPDGELAGKCLSCSGAPHPMCDLVVTVDGVRESCADPSSGSADTEDARDRQIAHLESLPADERWRFWQRQFGRCLRCYACRAVCPLCYCSSCIADKHRPQWVPTAIDERGNSAWNVIRAVHLAGRCSGCDECARVCPADIRLDLINRKLALEVERQFGAAGLDPEQKSALVDFRMEDAEEFIL